MPDGHDADAGEPDPDAVEPATGMPTEARLFYLFGAFSLLLGVIYLVWTSTTVDGTEWAGGVALIFAAAFGLFFATFLNRSLRQAQHDIAMMEDNLDAGDEDWEETLYLPDQSVWPIAIGVGASLTLAGVALGFWVMIPGIALFAHGIIGFAHQSRSRT